MKETRRSYIVLRIAKSWGILHYYIILLLFKFMLLILFIRNLMHLKYCSFKAHLCKFYIYSHYSQTGAGKVWFSHSYIRVLSSKATQQQTSLNLNFWSFVFPLFLLLKVWHVEQLHQDHLEVCWESRTQALGQTYWIQICFY